MNAIAVRNLTYRYGSTVALDAISFDVEAGQVYALLGPNGSGKTTLIQILTGMRAVPAGHAFVLGVDVARLQIADRARIGYVAEGQRLPGWMRLSQYEAYLAPLYPTWDVALANRLRERFSLDPDARLSALSRGTAMKAALLCALAPRPALLLMDEPFTGMDALVKDDIVRGVLDTAASDGQSVLLCSHDLAEVETLCDAVGLLQGGQMLLSESMESLRERFCRVVISADGLPDGVIPPGALQVDRAGLRTSCVVSTVEQLAAVRASVAALGAAARIEVESLSLRELFVAVAGTEASATADR